MAPTFGPARARRLRPDVMGRRDGQLLDAVLSNPSITHTPILASDIPSTIFLDRSVKTSLVPAGYGTTQSGPSSGAVVGITLGAVAGFLLFVALIYTCVNFGTFGLVGGFGRSRRSRAGSTFFSSNNASSVLEASSYVSRRAHEHKRHRRRSSGSKRHRRHSHSHIHKARPIVVDPPMERVVIKEHIRRTSRTVPRPRPGPSIVESASHSSDDNEIVVEEEIDEDRRRRQRSRVESDDDEVVVIEEDSLRARPPRSSRGGSSRR